MRLPSKTLVLAAVAPIAALGFSLPAEAAKFIETVTIGENFTGTSLSQSGFIPPDTMGAVGPDHIVELINGAYAVYEKGTNGTLAQPRTSLNQFWIDAGVNPTLFSFDPRVLYDPFSERWYATAVDNPGSANNLLVAASNTSNPLDGWIAVAIDSDTDDSHWADFPTLGINADNLFISASMFPLIGGGVTTTILEVDKANLGVVGLNQNLSLNDTGFTVQPVVDLDNTSDPHPMFSAFSSSGIYRRSDMDSGVFTPDGNIPVPAFSAPPLARQPGGPNNVSTGDNRFSSNLILKDGWIWGVHTEEVDSRSALRWFKLDEANNTLVETGVIADPDRDFYYGSIAVNDWKEVVIGFSCSGDDLFVSSCAVVGQNVDDATTFDDPMLLKEGVATYERLDGIGRNRWGDYSATVVDPEDPFSFWTFQEFVSDTNQWSIQVTEIKLSKVPEPTTLLGLLALGTLGVGSAFKNQLKQKFPEKEKRKVG